MLLDKSAILSAQDLKRETVPVPEWGDGATVLVGELSAVDRLKFSECISEDGNKGQVFIALALSWFLINEDGTRMFESSDSDALSGKSPVVLKRIFEVAEKLNGMGKAAEEEVKN